MKISHKRRYCYTLCTVTGRRKGHHTNFKTSCCRAAELQLITDHAGPNDRRLSTPARARGYSGREHITRGTHHQGNIIISPGAWPGEQKIRGSSHCWGGLKGKITKAEHLSFTVQL